MTTYYDRLGVDTSATPDEIESAWRTAVKDHHPDVSDDPDAEEKFKRVREAYEVLSDEDKRARYDRLGHDTYTASNGDFGGGDDAADAAQQNTTRASQQRHSGQTAGENGEQRTGAYAGHAGTQASYRGRRHTRGTAASEPIWGTTDLWAEPAPPDVFTALSAAKRVLILAVCLGIPTIISFCTLQIIGWALLSVSQPWGLVLSIATAGVAATLVFALIAGLEALVGTHRRLNEVITS